MKAIQIVVFVTLCITFGNCDVPGTLIGFSRIASRTVSCLNTYQPVCGDCQTLWKCENSITPPTINCKDTYPDRPYCNEVACSATKSSECAAAVKFRCTDAGYFPNPLNCSKYHLCAAAGAIDAAVYTYECPPRFVYNPATTMCKLQVSPTDCFTVDCATDPYGYAVYPADNTFYASCSGDGEPLMLKCAKNHVYNQSSFKCVFQCPREGRIADPTAITKYYECYLDGSVYYYRHLECVSGYLFDEKIQQCKKFDAPIG